MQKLCCYVDEAGQDAQGKLFLVIVAITDKRIHDEIAEQLLNAEKQSKKGALKWRKTSQNRRIAYLENVMRLLPYRLHICYAVYTTSGEYVPLTTYTIAKAIRTKTADREYGAIVIIDGFNERECQRVAHELRALRIRCKAVRGMRDESSPFIRCADALAGFLRDQEEGQPYTEKLHAMLSKKIMRLV